MLLGCIGNDTYGQKIQDALQKVNVKNLLEINQEHKTSRCACGIYLKERCLMPQIRASTLLSMDFVEKNLESIIRNDLLLIEGYFVIEKFDIVQRLVKHFRDNNKKIVFTLSATFMVENFHDKMLEISNESDIVVCNNEEASAFCKSTSTCMEEVAETIHKLLKPRDRLLIITCGQKPVIISKYSYENKCLDFVLKSSVYPVPKEEIVDTNGAGDCKYYFNC
jgi:adenosine kinase